MKYDGGMYDAEEMEMGGGGGCGSMPYEGGMAELSPAEEEMMMKEMMGGAKSAWMTHLMKVYKEGKAANPLYRFSMALKDASKTYERPTGLPPVAPKKKRTEPKTLRGRNAWNEHVMKTFEEGRAKNKDYGLDDAMIDASKTYERKTVSKTEVKITKGSKTNTKKTTKTVVV